MHISNLRNRREKEKQDNSGRGVSVQELIGNISIEGGIIIAPDSCSILLEVLPVNFKLKSQSERDFIIQSYEELLKIVKVPFQIFTIVKRADSRAHMDFMNKQLETETEENVRAMIQEYQTFVSEISYKRAVRRRFIVVIPYAVPAGMKLRDVEFRDAGAWLIEKRQQFADAFQKCGNETVIPERTGADQFTAEILYELLNVNSSESQRMVRV